MQRGGCHHGEYFSKNHKWLFPGGSLSGRGLRARAVSSYFLRPAYTLAPDKKPPKNIICVSTFCSIIRPPPVFGPNVQGQAPASFAMRR